jgi:hypothetical protein
MSMTQDELLEIKNRANTAIDNAKNNEEAARIALDVRILLLVLKLTQGDNNGIA